DLGALLADDHTGTPGEDRDRHLARLSLDVHVGNGRARVARKTPRAQIPAHQLVFLEQRRQILVCVIPRAMLARHAQAKANRIGFLSHYFPSLSATMFST